MLVKSFINFTGNKYKLLPQILNKFPQNISTFYDVFGGSGTVFMNINADNYVYNDINYNLANIFKTIIKKDINEIISIIENYMKYHNLSKDNKQEYYKAREVYNNTTDKDPLFLYVLGCFSFNNQLRFNRENKFNSPSGYKRSQFTSNMRNNLIAFKEWQKNRKITIHSEHFSFIKDKVTNKDFVYFDPPYYLSYATYNTGWEKKDMLELFEVADFLNKNNIKFALSELLETKGNVNVELDNWRKRYNTHFLDINYTNASCSRKDRESKDVEVLITNY